MLFRRCCLALALATAALGAGACGDPFKPQASRRTQMDTLTVFALSGTPVSAPTALNMFTLSPVRAEFGLEFDIVFDIDSTGQALIYPAHVLGGGTRAGVRKMTVPFDSVRAAPTDGYKEGSATAVSEGDVLVVRARATICSGDIRPLLYSKLVIDDVDVAARTISFRIRVDPNCGFRDLTHGFPAF